MKDIATYTLSATIPWLFIALKLTGVINWSWYLVLSPFILCGLVVFGLCIWLIVKAVSEWYKA